MNFFLLSFFSKYNTIYALPPYNDYLQLLCREILEKVVLEYQVNDDGKKSAIFLMKNSRKSLRSAGGNLFIPWENKVELPPADVIKQY